MAAFLLRRLALAALVLVALSCASFCFFAWQEGPGVGVPGAGSGSTPSLLEQWWTWVRGLAGGTSWAVVSHPFFFRNFTVAGPSLVGALGHTVALLAATLVLVVALAVGVALVAAARRGSALDLLLRTLSYLAWAVPAFLLALLVQSLVNRVAGPRCRAAARRLAGPVPRCFRDQPRLPHAVSRRRARPPLRPQRRPLRDAPGTHPRARLRRPARPLSAVVAARVARLAVRRDRPREGSLRSGACCSATRSATRSSPSRARCSPTSGRSSEPRWRSTTCSSSTASGPRS